MIEHSRYLSFLATLAFTGHVWAGHTNEVLQTQLDGREEVGEDISQRLVGDPDGKGEAYVFGVDGDLTTLCYVLTVEKIQLVPVGQGMAAHIHEGERDANGPVVAVLAGPEDGNAGDCLTEGETGKFPTEEAGIVQRILQNPDGFYINVHNPEYPNGAIRGQLRNQIHEHDHEHHGDPEGVPSTPMNLTVEVYSSSAVELFWERSTDDGLVVEYKVYRDDSFVSIALGNSYFDEGLSPGTSYQYSVVAIDNMANESQFSQSINVTTDD